MDITPHKHNIDTVFGKTVYHIDFYQREYKWTKEPVERLLDDIFYKFNETYQQNSKLTPDENIIKDKYNWYYLNTYVTNEVSGRVYIVDGQQRLTTIMLILINLYHLSKKHDSDLSDWLSQKIFGQSGRSKNFWIKHESHEKTLEELYQGNPEHAPTDTGLTAINMVNNYKTIEKWLEKNIQDKNHLETFIFYFLYRLVLIDLSVEQTDVPMVFEVINDRGVRLKPYEILKGKLLRQINKKQLDDKEYNQLWESNIRSVNQINDDEADQFFRFYLKSRFGQGRSNAQKFDGDYHRLMFSFDFQENIPLANNEQGVMDFLDKDFRYYAKLYTNLATKLRNDDSGSFAFHRLNDIDGILLLGLAVCNIDDPQENQKIECVAKELDRLFSLMQLQSIYESNKFQEILHKISVRLRSLEDISLIRDIFNIELTSLIKETYQIENSDVEPFSYAYFKNTGVNLNSGFKRYFLARIENFLAENTNNEMRSTYQTMIKSRHSKEGFHIEHILSKNSENLSYFNNDEDLFNQERNRLGGVLLLKGRDNISSGNELYQDKLKTYASSLLWNETLIGNTYKSNLAFRDLKERYNLADLEAIDIFDRQALEKRHHLLFKIAKIIWS